MPLCLLFGFESFRQKTKQTLPSGNIYCVVLNIFHLSFPADLKKHLRRTLKPRCCFRSVHTQQEIKKTIQRPRIKELAAHWGPDTSFSTVVGQHPVSECMFSRHCPAAAAATSCHLFSLKRAVYCVILANMSLSACHRT